MEAIVSLFRYINWNLTCYLIPQIYSARRFNVDLSAFPRLLEIEMRADLHPAFIAAHPDNQPDAD